MNHETAIIILNWNGWEDTIECLESLYGCTGNFFIVLVDNGSTNDSVNKIKEYLETNDRQYLYIDEGDKLENKPTDRICILYKLLTNYGFARGNNMALELLDDYLPERCLLLNNDTNVTPTFLTELVVFMDKYPCFRIVSPLIYYYYEKDIIWNAGGDIIRGNRKYHYAEKTKEFINEELYIPCTFITGCALLFDTELIDNDGHIFTERFFHGEEDFDLSLRMKENGIQMACVLSSVIYHKVNRATQSMNNMGKIYIHFLNRYINLKHHYAPIKYRLWKIWFTSALFGYLLIKQKLTPNESWRFCSRLLKESRGKDNVTKNDFFYYLSHFTR